MANSVAPVTDSTKLLVRRRIAMSLIKNRIPLTGDAVDGRSIVTYEVVGSVHPYLAACALRACRMPETVHILVVETEIKTAYAGWNCIIPRDKAADVTSDASGLSSQELDRGLIPSVREYDGP